jgi:nucleoside-diphosphate-sugar epimerase
MTEIVLVIGGTGELGAPVARQLSSDGYRVQVLARTLPAAPDRDARLEYVQGDLDVLQRTPQYPGWLCRGACERARRTHRRVLRSRRAPRTSPGG